MTINLLLIPLTLWGAFCWRARGGGAADELHFRFGGTVTTRILFSALMIAPLLPFHWHAAVLWPAFWAGWSISGWGAFQGMAPGPYRPNPVATLLLRLGLRDRTTWFDFAGMAIEGLICLAIPAAAVWWLVSWRAAALLWVSGLAFAPLYLAGDRLRFPTLGRFVGGQAWREVLVGAWVMLVLGVMLGV